MRYIIEITKKAAVIRILLITDNVVEMLQSIIEDRIAPKVEKFIDDYSGILFYYNNGMILMAMH